MNEFKKNIGVHNTAFDEIAIERKLKVYEKMKMVRLMEEEMVKASKAGTIKCSLYLSSGQEAVTAALSECIKGYQIFAQHRSGDTYLNFGGSPEALRDELYALSTGCSQGRGGHIGIQWHSDGIDMYGDNLLIGQCVPRGVGAALGNGKNTMCVFGDGAAEEDYVLESLGFASTHHLPVLFVCTDNDLAILTRVSERRKWSMVDIAQKFGMDAYDLADDPWTIMQIVEDNEFRLPCFLNVHVCRKYWHVGLGTDGPMEWDRLEIVREQLANLNLSDIINSIDVRLAKYIKEVWNNDFG